MSKPPETINGASVVIWYKDEDNQIYILTGKESTYLTDEHPDDNDIKTKQVIEATNVSEAKRIFRKNAIDLEARFPELKPIMFDTPISVSGTTNRFTVNYRHLKNTFKYGILKGGIEPQDNGDIRRTIVREVSEEIGFIIDKKDFVYLGICSKNACFSLMLKPRDISPWNDKIADRIAKKNVEIFELSFKKMDDIVPKTLNQKSKCAIDLFKPYLKKVLQKNMGVLTAASYINSSASASASASTSTLAPAPVPISETYRETLEKMFPIFIRLYAIEDKNEQSVAVNNFLKQYSGKLNIDEVYDLWYEYKQERKKQEMKKGGYKSSKNKNKSRKRTIKNRK